MSALHSSAGASRLAASASWGVAQDCGRMATADRLDAGRQVAVLCFQVTRRVEESSVPRSGPGAEAVLDALPEGLMVLAADGRLTFANSACSRILGVPLKTLMRSGVIPPGWHLVADDGTPLPEAEHPAHRAARTRSGQEMEMIGLLRPDDSALWLAVSTGALGPPNAAGRQGVVCTFVDVSRHRQHDMALAARERQLLRALAQAPFTLWSADRRGQLSFVAGAALSSRSSAELIGRPAAELSPEAGAIAADVGQALDGERLTTLSRHEGRTFETRFYPSDDGSGEIDGVSGITIDVTERAAAEAEQAALRDALRHAAEEWRATFDAIDSPLLLLDAEGFVRRVNRATRDLWGEPFERIIGSPLPEHSPGLPWAAIARAAAQSRESSAVATLQERDETRESHWDVTACPLATPAGAVIVLARDVSQIVELRESLRRSERLAVMGELVSGVAHQVRSPLFGISATLDAWDAEPDLPVTCREFAQALRVETTRLSRLMSDLLNFGRARSIRREETSLAEVIGSAVAACRTAATEAGVTIATSVPDDLPSMPLDEERVAEAFHNLIENAVQHSRLGAEVRITAQVGVERGIPAVTCSVDDRGPGFNEGDWQQLFRPFFSRRTGGTGLGLSIAQRIIEEHGGRISAGNRAEGGARVTVTIPLPGAQHGLRGQHG